ncbi:tRNA CCA-pyrophosphorylase [Candidatus Thorarchaeota archaeon]|nr:MAG: tRNA CCA-pyrophosphorylase [Candidatus Thorarchaeota archaeon]
MGVEVTLVTGRTLRQGRAMEQGKLTDEYAQAVGYCEVSPSVLRVLEIDEGEAVKVESYHGSVVVRAKENSKMETNMAFIPCGPYANMVIGSDTTETGMPDFKGTAAKLFAAESESVLSPQELLLSILEEDE